jgi:hypothetical protein
MNPCLHFAECRSYVTRSKRGPLSFYCDGCKAKRARSASAGRSKKYREHTAHAAEHAAKIHLVDEMGPNKGPSSNSDGRMGPSRTGNLPAVFDTNAIPDAPNTPNGTQAIRSDESSSEPLPVAEDAASVAEAETDWLALIRQQQEEQSEEYRQHLQTLLRRN